MATTVALNDMNIAQTVFSIYVLMMTSNRTSEKNTENQWNL